jgi:hypothetical protein
VRELEFSKITLRLVEKVDKKGEEGDHAIAKLSGPTLPILRQGLVCFSTASSPLPWRVNTLTL